MSSIVRLTPGTGFLHRFPKSSLRGNTIPHNLVTQEPMFRASLHAQRCPILVVPTLGVRLVHPMWRTYSLNAGPGTSTDRQYESPVILSSSKTKPESSSGSTQTSEKKDSVITTSTKGQKPVEKIAPAANELGQLPSTTVPQKKPLMQRIKDELHHLWDGTKLLALETKISTKLVYRMIKGHTLSRREQRQLSRTSKDLLRLIPFSFFIIIPFMELFLPVALWLFPNMLPSTFQTKKAEDDKRRKLLKVRMEVSKFLQETMAESAKARIGNGNDADTVMEIFHKVRSTGEPASTEDLIKVARVFEEEYTLDNLSRPQLVSICQYMNLGVYGLDNMLRARIRNQIKLIRVDDRMISSEGVDSLTIPELQAACTARGMRSFGVSPARLRTELKQWLDLHLNHKVPMTLLILMRAFSISQTSATLSADALQATLSSLPDNLLSEAELKVSEAHGKATNKQRLAVLEQQEDLIEDEQAQQRDQESRSKTQSEPDSKPKSDA
ncbi:LETM1 domain-containing protein ylh47 [Dispira parvispora]|uniref:LETM1 domain-containing protein ylh47 n=1 Tax=Dispira parvispora TaxID=1520584 RepID=A0A9W8ATJ4_9FUNG|nr:LETM1 domain-containing protein ylh47 [Dispira parvispora]